MDLSSIGLVIGLVHKEYPPIHDFWLSGLVKKKHQSTAPIHNLNLTIPTT
nr:MAG TPA: hypothetical protein [Caudoviricetes sp.]